MSFKIFSFSNTDLRQEINLIFMLIKTLIHYCSHQKIKKEKWKMLNQVNWIKLLLVWSYLNIAFS